MSRKNQIRCDNKVKNDLLRYVICSLFFTFEAFGTNDFRPTNKHICNRISNYSSDITFFDQRISSINKKVLITLYVSRFSTNNHQQTTTNKQPPTNNHQPKTINKKVLITHHVSRFSTNNHQIGRAHV